jgi:2-oxoisovalerate dehydrogenase E1 component
MDNDLFRKAALIRNFEERLLSLFSEGRLSGTVHTCIGQELCALAVINQIRDDDWVFSNHRCHGHYLARTSDVAGLLAEIMGLQNGICAGRGGSQHICRNQFLSNGVQGGGVPIASGCAMALKSAGQSGPIAVAFIGDGTLGEGVLYEALNMAGKMSVPLLLVLEHNGYAQSTNTERTISGDIRKRFEAFGWRFWETSIWKEQELFSTAREAAQHVRAWRSPAALCIGCYRLKAHSKGDDDRDAAEIKSFLERDPMIVFEREQPDAASRIKQECTNLLTQTLADIETTTRSLPKTDERATILPDPRSSQRQEAQTSSAPKNLTLLTSAATTPAPQRVVECLRQGLRDLLSEDPKVILLGEDLEDPYGGAFKVTKGLSTDFPGRVLNTPISEAAVVGVGSGLALAGMRPIVEIMFGDFILLAADQIINQASKFAYMYNCQVRVPIIIRAPMGGRRGYGATHSQSLEKHLFGVPGLTVVAANALLDPALLLKRIHDHLDSPCVLIENKLLYTEHVKNTAADGRPWLEDGAVFPTLKLDAQGRGDLTVVAYGEMVGHVEAAVRRAFEEEEILAEIIVPTRIHPLDAAPILESAAKTGRLLVVEEGQGFAGFGAEVLALCAERAERPVAATRVFAAPHPIPCSRDLEKQALPDASSIFDAMLRLVKG